MYMHIHIYIYIYIYIYVYTLPKNEEIALLLATNRGCVVKYVAQKRNESNDQYQ